MQQTGKYYIYAIEDDRRVISPIANAFIYFIREENQEAIALTVKTDEGGNYDFNLDVGKYIVATSAGGIEQVLANGSLFEITSESQIDAFEKWLNLSNDENVDSALLEKFRELMQRTESAAKRAENASQIVDTNLEENLNKLSERTDLGLVALSVEKNSSIEEIRSATASSKAGLEESINNAVIAKQSLEKTAQESIENINNTKQSAESSIDSAKQEAEQQINDAKTGTLGEISQAKDAAITDIEEKIDGLATKEYVDTAIENIDIPEVDLTGYATEDFVTEEISRIDIPSVSGFATKSWVNSNSSKLGGEQSVKGSGSSLEEVLVKVPENSVITRYSRNLSSTTLYYRPIIRI